MRGWTKWALSDLIKSRIWSRHMGSAYIPKAQTRAHVRTRLALSSLVSVDLSGFWSVGISCSARGVLQPKRGLARRGLIELAGHVVHSWHFAAFNSIHLSLLEEGGGGRVLSFGGRKEGCDCPYQATSLRPYISPIQSHTSIERRHCALHRETRGAKQTIENAYAYSSALADATDYGSLWSIVAAGPCKTSITVRSLDFYLICSSVTGGSVDGGTERVETRNATSAVAKRESNAKNIIYSHYINI